MPASVLLTTITVIYAPIQLVRPMQLIHLIWLSVMLSWQRREENLTQVKHENLVCVMVQTLDI